MNLHRSLDHSNLSERIARACSLIVGWVFVYAAASKAYDPAPVRTSIAFLTGWSDTRLALAPVILAALEAALGMALIAAIWRRAVSIATLVVLVGFSAAVAVLMLNPHAPPCGCSGAAALALTAKQANQIALARNGLLVLLTGVAAICERRSRPSPAHTPTAFTPQST